MLILIKTKIYFLVPLKCKINSNNCQNIYIDLVSISEMRKPFLFLPIHKKSNFSGFLYHPSRNRMKFSLDGLPYAALKIVIGIWENIGL